MNNDQLSDIGVIACMVRLRKANMLYSSDLASLAKQVKSRWGRKALCAFLGSPAEFAAYEECIGSLYEMCS